MEKDSNTEPGSLKNRNVDLHDAHRDSLERSVADSVKDRKGNVVQIQDFGEASHPIQAQPDQAALPTSQWKNQGDSTNSTLSTSRVPPLSYSGKEVSRTPKKKFEEFRKVVMAEGNSEAKQFICAVADFLGEIEQEKDYKYNLLVLQNGLLISLCEVTKDKNYRSRVMIEQRSRENGMFWLYATLSEDNVVTYKKGREFRIMYPALGRGAEGTVYTAMDNGGSGVFAVKQMSLKAFCEKKTNLSAFLRLAGCEHICSPYGVLLDEEEKCVFFLMEKLKGETLKRFFDRGERIGVRKAVGYAVQFMKALRYIHSKRMVYTDVKASNVILDGSDAIAIDITGVKSPSNKQYYYYSLLDAINAISLLNKMLLEPGERNSETSQSWKPSAADRKRFVSN
ncbi:uncharacterized protein LOC118413699 [Branchiostoma floridae]|uniref:mitogen-activated protein kinase kinase n=1 Tax=Branchiostoma floridae TaxID=7739 RepID=A0A9J7L0E1_BRAFL|nr:uncharacterized protein LOC118413699 [Branchiostoma floridae]